MKAVLRENATSESAMLSGPEFEYWIKFGLKGPAVIRNNEETTNPGSAEVSPSRSRDTANDTEMTPEHHNMEPETRTSTKSSGMMQTASKSETNNDGVQK